MDESIQGYEELLSDAESRHEWILSNLALAHLKKGNYHDVIKYTEQIIEKTRAFASKTILSLRVDKNIHELRELLQKTYFRQAKAFEGQKEIEKALESSKEALSYNEKSAEVKRLQSQLQVSSLLAQLLTEFRVFLLSDR